MITDDTTPNGVKRLYDFLSLEVPKGNVKSIKVITKNSYFPFMFSPGDKEIRITPFLYLQLQLEVEKFFNVFDEVGSLYGVPITKYSSGIQTCKVCGEDYINRHVCEIPLPVEKSYESISSEELDDILQNLVHLGMALGSVSVFTESFLTKDRISTLYRKDIGNMKEKIQIAFEVLKNRIVELELQNHA